MYNDPKTAVNTCFDFLDLPVHRLYNYPNHLPGGYNFKNETIRQSLAEYFKPHNQKLEEYLGILFYWT